MSLDSVSPARTHCTSALVGLVVFPFLVHCSSGNNSDVPNPGDAVDITTDAMVVATDADVLSPPRDVPPGSDVQSDTPSQPTGTPLFVGIGNWGYRARTVNGTNWIYCGNPSTGNDHSPDLLRGIGYGDGVFVAVGGDANSMVMRSLDGEHWEVDLHPTTACAGEAYPPSCRNWMGDVAYGNGVWIAGGGNGALMRSMDQGRTWRGLHPDPTPNAVRRMVFGNGRFVGSTDGGFAIVSSDGGERWSARQIWQHSFNLAFGNNVFIAFGAHWNGSGFDRGCFVSSNGGDSWTACASTVANAEHFAHDGVRWVARVGNGYAVSMNGVDWTSRTAMNVPLQFEFDGTQWVGVAGGRAWRSTTLDTWEQTAMGVGDFRDFTVGRVLAANLPVMGVAACVDNR